jgi:hypothetical protein
LIKKNCKRVERRITLARVLRKTARRSTSRKS